MVGTIIWRATGDDRGVEDLAQEAFLRVFRALPLFAGGSKLSTWVCTIAHRVAIDHVRKGSRLKESALPSPDEERERLLARHGAADATPEQLLSREEGVRLVHEHLAALPEKYRLPLVYSAFDELDHATIGTMLGVPAGTVKTLVFRARQMLKARMASALAARGTAG